MTVHSVYVTFANAEEAEHIGRQMVEERLAACVNILGPCRPIYRWQGTVETANEVSALFKTSEAQVYALIARIGQLHSYEMPAITAWAAADASESFADWVEESANNDLG